MRRRARLVVLALVGLLLAGTAGFVSGDTAEADEWFPVPPGRVYTIDGHGFGHGHGMSQRGAQGAASKGLSASQILGFYYPGTTQTNVGGPRRRLQLSGTSSSDVRIDSAAGTTVMYIQNGTNGDLAGAPV